MAALRTGLTLSKAVRHAIQDALSARFNEPVRIAADVQNFWPSSVFRCTLQQSPGGIAPGTVIVRIPRDGTARSGTSGLQHERAALEHLATIGSSLAPRFLTGSDEAGFLVTEDLGDHPSLLDLLLGKELVAAHEGILAFAHGLGKLHAQTAAQPEALRAALPIVRISVAEHWQQVGEAVNRLGLPSPHGANGDVEALASLLEEAGDCLAISSGDASVVNCKIFAGTARFFDFEEACYRHAFIDAAILRYTYPTGGPPWYLPREITAQIEAAYRAELAQTCTVAHDNQRFERSMTAACAAWTIIRLARLPRVDAGPDQDPWLLLPGDWSAPIPVRSRRRQLVAILETYIDSAHRSQEFEAFTTWCELLTDTLRNRWPEATEKLSLYPAFQ